MKVRAVKSFGGSLHGHKAAGSVFELPDGVDWLEAGLVVPAEGEVEAAALEPEEKAVKAVPKKKTTTTRRKRRTSAAKK